MWLGEPKQALGSLGKMEICANERMEFHINRYEEGMKRTKEGDLRMQKSIHARTQEVNACINSDEENGFVVGCVCVTVRIRLLQVFDLKKASSDTYSLVCPFSNLRFFSRFDGQAEGFLRIISGS